MKNRFTKKKDNPEVVRMRQKKNKTLVIHYREDAMCEKREGFRNISDPDRIISRRNASKMEGVFYMGEPFDISTHQKLYSKKELKF